MKNPLQTSTSRHPYPGRLVTLEGGDGAGKTTQARLLALALESCGLEVMRVREPGGTQVGERLRAIVLDPECEGLCDRAELLIYEAARAQLVCEVLIPALEAGKVIVCDRFTDSTVAYQGNGRGIDVGFVERANDFATRGIRPDATVVLVCDACEERRRQNARGESDRLESAGGGFHDRVSRGFASIAGSDDPRIRAVDGAGAPSEVAMRVAESLSDIFPGLPEAARALDGEAGS